MEQDANNKAFTVTQAVLYAKSALESFTLTLVGEVSELSIKRGYKAAYFTVKDDQSNLPCMMWMNRYLGTGIDLRVGDLVQLTGRFTIYPAKGRMSFDVFSLALAGEGELRQRVARLAEKLEREGLMSPEAKRPVPQYMETIGLVTSPRGAAVHDVLRTLRRRFPLARVLLAGVPVEGKNAPAGLIDGLHAVAQAGAEAILLVRGGGSFEDLMPFNDEALARAIAACPVPVVTGIGHEPDTCIADMVADLRCSTPTAAAEKVSPNSENLNKGFDNAARRLHAAVSRTLQDNGSKIALAETRAVFTDPGYLLASDSLALDYLGDSLYKAIPVNLARDLADISRYGERLENAGRSLLGTADSQMDAATSGLVRAATSFATRFDNEIAMQAARLNDLSPLTILSRGYSITRGQEGRVLRSVSQVDDGEAISVDVADGTIRATVTTTELKR